MGNYGSSNGATLLWHAAYFNQVEMAKFLIGLDSAIVDWPATSQDQGIGCTQVYDAFREASTPQTPSISPPEGLPNCTIHMDSYRMGFPSGGVQPRCGKRRSVGFCRSSVILVWLVQLYHAIAMAIAMAFAWPWQCHGISSVRSVRFQSCFGRFRS